MMETPEMKAAVMRNCIEETCRSFREEGAYDLAEQTKNATADADDDTLARLYDLLQKTSNKDEAVRMIQQGEA